MPRFVVVIPLAVALVPTPLLSQAPLVLGKPNAEFPEPFTQITSLRELKDGRVLVVDQREATLQLIDFKAGTATKIGRTGAGPGEYGFPGRLVSLPGDTSVLHDPTNARFLLIRPNGSPGETFRLGEDASTNLGGRGSVPRGSDARGRLFFEGSPFVNAPGRGMVPADSAPLLRYDRGTRKLDTLAFVQLSKGNAKVSPGPSGGISIMVGAKAWPDRDVWVGLPDGGISIARVSDYHIERYSPTGVRTTGAPVRFTPVTVTEAEKEAWREERRRLMGRPRSGGGTASTLRDAEFTTAMPPFLWPSAYVRPNGEFWVLRSHRAAEVPTYDVFSGTALVARVSLPAKTSLAGFGNGTVYVIRRDQDDLEYLQRYVVPAFAK